MLSLHTAVSVIMSSLGHAPSGMRNKSTVPRQSSELTLTRVMSPKYDQITLSLSHDSGPNDSRARRKRKWSFIFNMYAVDGQWDLGVLAMLYLRTSGIHPDHCGGRLHVLPRMRCMGKQWSRKSQAVAADRGMVEKFCSINWKAGRRPQYSQKVPWLRLIWKLVERRESLLMGQLHYYVEWLWHGQPASRRTIAPRQPRRISYHQQGNKFSKQRLRHSRPASQRTIAPRQRRRILYHFILFQTHQQNPPDLHDQRKGPLKEWAVAASDSGFCLACNTSDASGRMEQFSGLVKELVVKHDVAQLKDLVDCMLSEESHFSLFARPTLQQVAEQMEKLRNNEPKDHNTHLCTLEIQIDERKTSGSLNEDMDPTGKNILVYDLGGGSFDVSLLTINDGVWRWLPQMETPIWVVRISISEWCSNFGHWLQFLGWHPKTAHLCEAWRYHSLRRRISLTLWQRVWWRLRHLWIS